MSLVIALAGSRKAVMGADRRAIIFFGSCLALEEELYSGQIRDERELVARAGELGALLQISDGREKVWRRGDILVGEVTEVTPRMERRRRIYVSPGASLQVEIKSEICEEGEGRECGLEGSAAPPEEKRGEARIAAWGGVGCTIFGNRFTQKLAADEVALAKGRVDEALIRRILQKAGGMTASVSREHTILSSSAIKADARSFLLATLQEDCQESGWKLCVAQ